MTTNFEALISKAIRALPGKSPVRAELTEAMKARADYRARGEKAAKTRKKAKRSKRAAH